jgi:hypothetical protein
VITEKLSVDLAGTPATYYCSVQQPAIVCAPAMVKLPFAAVIPAPIVPWPTPLSVELTVTGRFAPAPPAEIVRRYESPTAKSGESEEFEVLDMVTVGAISGSTVTEHEGDSGDQAPASGGCYRGAVAPR